MVSQPAKVVPHGRNMAKGRQFVPKPVDPQRRPHVAVSVDLAPITICRPRLRDLAQDGPHDRPGRCRHGRQDRSVRPRLGLVEDRQGRVELSHAERFPASTSLIRAVVVLRQAANST